MTGPRLDDDRLQRFFDDELDEHEAREVRLALESSPEEQARIEQLERLSNLVQLAAEEAPRSYDRDELFASIAKGLDEPQGSAGGLRVIEGEGRSPQRGSAGKGRARATGAIVGGLALAAAVALAVLGPWGAEGPDGAPTARTKAPEESREAYAEARETAPQGSEVVEVDFGGNTGTVFEVEGDSGEPIAVVWIDDQGAP